MVADLEQLGLIEKIEDYTLSGGPLRTHQGHRGAADLDAVVREDQAAGRKSHRVVESGEIVFIPENWTKVYYEWMDNIRDWCISRQLWWGHRIPGVALPGLRRDHRGARGHAKTCSRCGSSRLEQDPDVLDTWFSSRPVAVLDARLAGQDRGSAHVLSDIAADHRLRHSVLLGGAHDHVRHGIHGRGAVPPGVHPRPGARRRAAEDVEDARATPSTRWW